MVRYWTWLQSKKGNKMINSAGVEVLDRSVLLPDVQSTTEELDRSVLLPETPPTTEELDRSVLLPEAVSTTEELDRSVLLPDAEGIVREPTTKNQKLEDKNRFLIKLSRETQDKIENAKKKESRLHTPGGGPVARTIMSGLGLLGIGDKQLENIEGSKDWYDPNKGVVNLAGLLQSGLPQQEKYGVLKDIARDVYQIPEDQFSKVLPPEMFHQKDEGAITGAITTAGRAIQQSTPFGEDLVRLALRRLQDFPPPKEWASPEMMAEIRNKMRSGGGAVVLDGGTFTVPAKVGSDADVKEFLQEEWAQHLKDVTEIMGESLGTFTEGLLAEGAQIAVPIASAALSATGVGAPVGAATAGASIAKSARGLAKAYETLINPTERLVKALAPKLSKRAAATIAANPLATTVLTNAVENFTINTQETLKERGQRAAIGAAIPLVPAAGKLAIKEAAIRSGALGEATQSRETMRMNETVESIARLKDMLGDKVVNDIVSGKTEAPSLKDFKPDEVKQVLEFMGRPVEAANTINRQIASQAVKNIIHESGEDSPVITNLDNFLALTGEGSLRIQAATAAYNRTIQQAHPETKAILEGDDGFHHILASTPDVDPVRLMEERHPNVANVFRDAYNLAKVEKRTDAMIMVARASTSPVTLDQVKNAIADADRDVGPEHSTARLAAYESLMSVVNPSVKAARAAHANNYKKAVELRDSTIGEIDGLIGLLKDSPAAKAKWIDLQDMLKNADTLDVRALPAFRNAFSKAMRISSSKLKSLTKTAEGQLIEDRVNNIKRNMSAHDSALAEMNADIGTIKNHARSDILTKRLGQLSKSDLEADRPSRIQQAIQHFTNPSLRKEDIATLVNERLEPLINSKKFDGDNGKQLQEAIQLFVQDVKESPSSDVVASLQPLRDVLSLAEEALGSPRHANLSGLKQMVAVAESMNSDNITVRRMGEMLSNTPPNRIVAALPTFGALADQVKTIAGLQKTANILAEVKGAFNHQMARVAGISFAEADTRFGHIFSILAGDVRTKIELKQDPNIPIVTDRELVQMFDAADALSAETIKSILSEVKRVLGFDLDIETFLAQFATHDNVYASNQIFQTRLADVDRYRAALAEWKEVRSFYSGKTGELITRAVNTEMNLQLQMRAAPAADGLEIEGYAGGIKKARRETTEEVFKSDLERIRSRYIKEWSDPKVTNAANAILGLDGLSRVGHMYRNSLEEDALIKGPAGELLSVMFSGPVEKGNKVVNFADDSVKAIAAVKKYFMGEQRATDIESSIHREPIENWQNRIMTVIDAFPEESRPEVAKLVSSADASGIPNILRYLAKHEVFGEKEYSNPKVWETAWGMVEEDAKIRRKLYRHQSRIYGEERKLYEHLGIQMNVHSWFERYISQRSSKESMMDEAPERLYHRAINKKKFKTTEEGQLAKTAGLGIKAEGNTEAVAHPMLTLIDDIMIGMMGARTSHSKEILRQRGILLDKMHLKSLASWMQSYYQTDLRDANFAQKIEAAAKAVAKFGQTGGTWDVLRGSRVLLPVMAHMVLGAHRPFMALSRPLSIFFKQPIQQATTAIVTSGPRDINGDLIDPFRYYAEFMFRTWGRFFTKYENLFESQKANYHDGMYTALSYLRDASDTKQIASTRRLLMGETKVGSATRAAYAVDRAYSVSQDVITAKFKENGEISMSSIVIETGASIHRRIIKDAMEMKEKGIGSGKATIALQEKYQDVFRTKSANEMFDMMGRVVKDAYTNGDEILNGGAFVHSLVPFLMFHATNSITRFGTLANPMYVNNFRTLFPNDLRFFAARFNNAYLGLGAVMPWLRTTTRTVKGPTVSPTTLDKVVAAKSMWSSKFVGVPEQLNGTLSLFMTGATLQFIGHMIGDDMEDTPSIEEEQEINNDNVKPMYRRLLASIKHPIQPMRAVGELIKPVSAFSLLGKERTTEVEDTFGLLATFMKPEYHEMYRNLNRLADATQSIPKFGEEASALLPTKYTEAYDDWMEAKKEGNEAKIREAYARMYSEYDKYALQEGGALLNYGLTIAGMDLVMKTLPWNIVRYSHLCEAEGRMFSDLSTKAKVINDPKYYSEWRELFSTLGIVDSAPYSEKLGAVTELIYSTLLKNGVITKDEYRQHTDVIQGLSRVFDEQDFSMFLGMSAGFVRDTMKHKEDREQMIKRKELMGEIPVKKVYDTGAPPDDYMFHERFPELIDKKLNKKAP